MFVFFKCQKSVMFMVAEWMLDAFDIYQELHSYEYIDYKNLKEGEDVVRRTCRLCFMLCMFYVLQWFKKRNY